MVADETVDAEDEDFFHCASFQDIAWCRRDPATIDAPGPP
jgi:hypothetical protein